MVERRATRSTKKTLTLVGIGASAGGYEAMAELLKTLPTDTGMAFVFVQHLAPDHDSVLSELLAKNTAMPVRKMCDKVKIKPDNLYVIPPNKDIAAVDGMLKLTRRNQHETTHHPVDTFFKSMAETYENRSIGVVLSGTATDGTLGLKAISAAGGVAIAQNETAKYQGMPRSAIDSDVVDYVLSPAEIARELARISSHPLAKTSAKNEPPEKAALKQILRLLEQRFGIDFTSYKQTTINRRVMRRAMLARFKSLDDYAVYLRENGQELETLYSDLLINVTGFFRDPANLQALRQEVLPQLVKGRQPDEPIRVWVPGCATGEEAYSLAITLLEYLDTRSLHHQIQIFATDLSTKSIERARAGIYPASALASVSPERLKKYFVKVDGSYQISKPIREMCVFAVHNFLSDPPFSRCDIISCQNVLIYLESSLQKQALAALHYGLKPGGWLLLGKSESTGGTQDLFNQVDKKHKLYTKKAKNFQSNTGFAFKDRPGRQQLAGLTGAQPKRAAAEQTAEQAADSLLLSKYVPASVIVTSDLEILQFRGDTSLYFQPASGRASLNLLKMVKSDLEYELRSALRQAKKTDQQLQKKNLQIKSGGKLHKLDLTIVPLPRESSQPHFLIVFTPITTSPNPPEPAAAKDEPDIRGQKIDRLERERDEARNQIKSIQEEYEAANEELQSSNEEVLSSNEELQSINEELETSQEELQSTSEELKTINDELQNRNLELKEARDYSQAVIATVREPLLGLNQELRVRTANQAFYRTFRVKPEQTEGCLIYELGDGQWDIPQLRQLLSEVLPRDKTVDNYEVTHSFPDIGERIMLLSARRLDQADNAKSMILLAIEDITERKRMEQQKDDFIGVASHELKTPVTSVKSYAQILRRRFEKAGDSQSASLASKMDFQLDKLTNLISDLLDVSKIEGGKLKLKKDYFNINNLVKETVEEMQRITDQHKIQTKLGPAKKVYGDHERIGQVITNFLSNAIKYSSPAGKIIVSSKISGDKLTLSVQDYGLGLSEKDKAKVFERFFRASGARQTTYPGQGLGLYIAAEIIDRHHGKIWVDSQPKQGATFYFQIPINKPASRQQNYKSKAKK